MTHQSTHNDDELEHIAPTLFSISKDGEFDVPAGYFEKLNDEVIGEAADLSELEALAPKFSELAKDDLLLTPEGFFGEFENGAKDEIQPETPELRTPAGFFEKQEKQILGRTVEAEETDDLGLPADFFEKQHEAILAKVDEEQKETKVFSLQRYKRIIISTAAAAAAIFALFVLRPEDPAPCETFACLLEQADLTAEDLMFLNDGDSDDLLTDDLLVVEEAMEDGDHEIIDYLIESDYDLDEIYYELQ